MKIVITGDGGQLAYELAKTAPETAETFFFSARELDITNQAEVIQTLTSLQPDVVINAAAYTAVDKAESDTELAYAVNHHGSEYLAKACNQIGAHLIHVSTDFVFDGTASTPYKPEDAPNPINVYGDSKLQGEHSVAEVLGKNATIIRTAWVYSVHGNNFVKTMLRLMTEKEELGIVYDQVGTPTWAKGLAQMIWSLLERQAAPNCTRGDAPNAPQSEASSPLAPQILHWTDAGVSSWYDFAVAIQELAIEKGMLARAIPIRPIPASHYPTPAARPGYSVIDKTTAEEVSQTQSTHWRKQLSSMLDELKNS